MEPLQALAFLSAQSAGNHFQQAFPDAPRRPHRTRRRVPGIAAVRVRTAGLLRAAAVRLEPAPQRAPSAQPF